MGIDTGNEYIKNKYARLSIGRLGSKLFELVYRPTVFTSQSCRPSGTTY